MEANTPFYLRRASGAKLKNVSQERIDWFLERAKRERDFKIRGRTSIENILEQLVLMEGNHILNAALMLFGTNPQRFCPNAVIKCSHYHGTDVIRPIPSQQIFEKTLFEQIDAAIDFVLSKLNRQIRGREKGPIAETKMEFPVEAISEIIINAVVHRDYDSNGSVQVTVFADRIEVINPGKLPEKLSVEDLTRKHASIPVNPFLARPFFLAGYINRVGYGTLNVIKYCREAHLPAPTFEQLNEQFSVTLWRDRFTDHVLAYLGVRERQRKGVKHVKEFGSISNSEYQKIAGVTRKTAARDLDALVAKGVLKRVGEKRGTAYILGEWKNLD
jgi:ATP-dependent DNA helicase RecG